MIKPVWIVCFTGHRPGSGPGRSSEALGACRDAIRDVLSGLLERAEAKGGTIELLTAAAAGADLEAIEAANTLGIPVHLILPNSVSAFERDFTGELEAEWPRARDAIEAAQGGERGGTFRIGRGDHTAPDCYHDANVEMLNASDLLIAVFNEVDSTATGGTADTLRLAEDFGVPAIRINPAQGAAVAWPEGGRVDARFEDVSQTLTGVCEDAASRPDAEPGQVLAAALKKLDDEASAHGVGFRRRLIASAILHLVAGVLAAVTAAFSPVFEYSKADKAPAHTEQAVAAGDPSPAEAVADQEEHHAVYLGPATIMTMVELVLVTVALIMTIRAGMRHLHHRWRRLRFAAEITRSHAATGRLLDPLHPIILRYMPGWRRFALTLSLCAHRAAPAEVDDTERAKAYLETRVQGQIKYFDRQHAKSKFWSDALSRLGVLAGYTAPVFIALALVLKMFFHDVVKSDFIAAFLAACVPILLPLIAASATALVVAGDHARRKERYHAMATGLKRGQQRIGKLRTPFSISSAVAETEQSLLDELVEWYLASKNTGH
ncbi:MAG: hypothetical protein AAGI68_07895 [Planctomycetota bacterium]